MKFFDRNRKLILIIFFAFVLRFVLAFVGTLRLDQGTFIAWSDILVQDGFKNFYNSWSDYLPGYLYILRLLGEINLLNIIPAVLLYKLPAIFADVATGLLIYKILTTSKGKKWGLIGMAIYVFNPAVIGNSTLWGQVDSFTAFFAMLSIYQLPFSVFVSATSLSIGTLIKPQVAFILPVILLIMIKEKWKLSNSFAYLLIGLLVFLGLFIPFWNHGNLITFVYERLNLSANQYPFTSVNAFNFWGVLGFWKPDSLFLQLDGYLLTLGMVVVVIITILKNWKHQTNNNYLLAAYIFAVSFIFFTRMHERHLLPLFAPLAIAMIENSIFFIPYIGFSLIYVANLYYSYIWISDDFRQVFSESMSKILAGINVGIFFFLFYSIVRNLKLQWSRVWQLINQPRIEKQKLPDVGMSKNTSHLILGVILTFSFITRIVYLDFPQTMYFDEVYHAFTAKVMMGVDKAKAWEWWNTPPDGFAYEWTHPPLAKLGMVVGMSIFGSNSFGWRVIQVILGVGTVFLVYLLAKLTFKDEMIGLASAGVFSLDGLVLVMNRIGMNDSYLLFFVFLTIYLFAKQKDFISSVSFGFAIASKWSAIWAVPILGILWLRRKRKPITSILWFAVLPFTIYLLTYLPMFLTGHDFSTWIGMQKQMWWYHTGLDATHPYTSSWLSWPFLVRPIYLYTSEEVGGIVSRIYAFGNPFVFWFGLFSIILSAVYSYLEKNKSLAFIVFAYLIFFVPWALSPRIMFLYHYLPSIPFLAIATGYILRRFPKMLFAYLFIGLLVFLYFYPHWIGLKIPLWLDKSYYWFDSWR